jgi:hypothetical protein
LAIWGGVCHLRVGDEGGLEAKLDLLGDDDVEVEGALGGELVGSMDNWGDVGGGVEASSSSSSSKSISMPFMYITFFFLAAGLGVGAGGGGGTKRVS